MNLANMFVIVFLAYYTLYFLKLFRKKNRFIIQTVNQEMNKMRNVAVKTVEEQRRFLDLKYPKSGKFKFTWRWLGLTILYLIVFVAVFQGWIYIFVILRIELKLWIAILFIMVAPIIFNILLEKFGLQKSDLSVFFRKGGRKK